MQQSVSSHFGLKLTLLESSPAALAAAGITQLDPTPPAVGAPPIAILESLVVSTFYHFSLSVAVMNPTSALAWAVP